MNAQKIYAQSINEVAELIFTVGSKITVLVSGHMGTGKSSILPILATMLPNHIPVYLDGTTLTDSADLFMVKYSEDGKTFKTVPLVELGLHLPNQPIILMIDELGKCNRSVILAFNRIMLERKHSGYELHEDSIVFATTNLGSEGIGDIIAAHSRDRITEITMRKPDNIEAIEYGINKGYERSLLGWYKQTPQLFHSHEDYPDNPDENPFIFHPQSTRTSFFTPRGGERADYILKQRHLLSDSQITALLVGTIGKDAALNLAAFIALSDKLPTKEEIKADPLTAIVPDSPSAQCMMVYQALATIERDWAVPWIKYMDRLPKPVQAMFVNGVKKEGYTRQDIIAQTREYGQWCVLNNYQFSADKTKGGK